MTEQYRYDWARAKALGIVLLVLILLIVLLQALSSPDPDAELVKTTREAMDFARESHRENISAVLWSQRFRLLAIVIGMTVPMLVVCLLWLLTRQDEPDTTEIIDMCHRLMLEQHLANAQLTQSPEDSPEALPEDSAQGD